MPCTPCPVPLRACNFKDNFCLVPVELCLDVRQLEWIEFVLVSANSAICITLVSSGTICVYFRYIGLQFTLVLGNTHPYNLCMYDQYWLISVYLYIFFLFLDEHITSTVNLLHPSYYSTCSLEIGRNVNIYLLLLLLLWLFCHEKYSEVSCPLLSSCLG